MIVDYGTHPDFRPETRIFQTESSETLIQSEIRLVNLDVYILKVLIDWVGYEGNQASRAAHRLHRDARDL